MTCSQMTYQLNWLECSTCHRCQGFKSHIHCNFFSNEFVNSNGQRSREISMPKKLSVSHQKVEFHFPATTINNKLMNCDPYSLQISKKLHIFYPQWTYLLYPEHSFYLIYLFIGSIIWKERTHTCTNSIPYIIGKSKLCSHVDTNYIIMMYFKMKFRLNY